MRFLRLALRSLTREWRLAELRTLAAALVLAVAALGVVSTLAARVENGIVAGAADLLGGDIAISSSKALPSSTRRYASSHGLEAVRTASFPSVAFVSGRSQLLDVTASEKGYPLRGKLQVGELGHPRIGAAPAPGTVYLDHRALIALHIGRGDQVQLGGRKLTVAAQLLHQPDGGDLFSLAPRALMNLADAQASGLLGVGSRVRHMLLLAGSTDALSRYQAWLDSHLPQDAQVITPQRNQRRLRRAYDRSGAFLRMSALLAALLAGIAIALSAQRYARRKSSEVALLRALGTPRRRVIALLAGTLGGLALPAAILGGALALGLAQGAWYLSRGLFPAMAVPLPLLPTAAAMLVGLSLTVAFALPPLARLADIPPMAVFRRGNEQRRAHRYDLLYLLPLMVALGLIWMQSGSAHLAVILAVSLGGTALGAALMAAAMLYLARRLASAAHPSLRLGLAALSRRRGLSLIQATALSLGLTALLLLAVIAPSLLESWRRDLPADTPNWFALNLQDDQRAAFARRLDAIGAEHLNMMPLAIGKLIAINGTPIEQLGPRGDKEADDNGGDREGGSLRLSWSRQLPEANHIIAGRWFDSHPQQAEVSVDRIWRDRYHLKLGDHMRFDVGERSVDATLTSIREVNWDSFRVNFFLMLDPAHAADLPHTWLASFYVPHTHSDALAALAREQPNLTLVDVDELLDRVREIIARVTTAVRWVLGFSLLAGALVLAAALASSAAERRHEAALLRTLGAHASQLRQAAACEFAALGLLAGVSASAGAAGAGLWLGLETFELRDYLPPAGPLLATALIAAVGVTLIGLAGTRAVIRTSPLLLLRRE